MTPVDDDHQNDETRLFAGAEQPVTEQPVTDRAWAAVDDQESGSPVAVESGSPGTMMPSGQPSGPQGVVSEPIEAAGGSAESSGSAAPPKPALPQPPEPALIAAGLALETKRGVLFRDVNITVRPASVAAVVGPSGTGRSSLLLALTGRMSVTAGTVRVAGHRLNEQPAIIRGLTSVARIGSVIGPEPRLTVQESVDERCLLDNVSVAEGRERFAQACAALDLEVEPSVLVGDLGGERATLLAVALACVRISAVIVVDDLDRGVDGVTQRRMVAALIRLATLTETGPAIVLTTTDWHHVTGLPVVIELETPTGKTVVTAFSGAAAPRSIAPAREPQRPPDDVTAAIPPAPDPATAAIPVVPELSNDRWAPPATDVGSVADVGSGTAVSRDEPAGRAEGRSEDAAPPAAPAAPEDDR